jgi:hypothetical protein
VVRRETCEITGRAVGHVAEIIVLVDFGRRAM